MMLHFNLLCPLVNTDEENDKFLFKVRWAVRRNGLIIIKPVLILEFLDSEATFYLTMSVHILTAIGKILFIGRVETKLLSNSP